MNHNVTLTWDAPADAVAGYNVYRGLPPGAEGASPLNLAPITALTYVDLGVTAGEKLEYSVTAVSASGVESIHTAQVVATVPLQPPTNLAATAN